ERRTTSSGVDDDGTIPRLLERLDVDTRQLPRRIKAPGVREQRAAALLTGRNVRGVPVMRQYAPSRPVHTGENASHDTAAEDMRTATHLGGMPCLLPRHHRRFVNRRDHAFEILESQYAQDARLSQQHGNAAFLVQPQNASSGSHPLDVLERETERDLPRQSLPERS